MGSHLARHLIARGWQVDILDDLSGGFRTNIPLSADFHQGSILDRGLISNLFAEREYRYVFHLAAYAAEGLSHFIRNYNYQNNVTGSVNLINAAVNHDIECFVFASSIAVYGEGELPLQEHAVPRPEDPYGIAKHAVELDLNAAHEIFGLNYTIYRPHNVYGEGQNLADPYRNVIGIFLRQLLSNQPLTVFGDGEQTRAFSHVDDVCGTIAQSIENPRSRQQIYNIGADQPCTINELIRELQRAVGRELEVQYLQPRSEVKHAYASHNKARTELGFKPMIELSEGLSRMTRWAKSLDISELRKFAGIEIKRDLPAGWQRYLD